MEKINEQLYKSNIYLVDKNRWLEEDKKRLIKRIQTAIEMLEENKTKENEEIIKVLKGRYMKHV
ncbi:MAG: hypothetical protein II625_05720 [Bacilli bacterium]|nr:hypothetical protein [Bacilli bacterium]